MSLVQKKAPSPKKSVSSQTTLSRSFQTTVSAKAVRALGLKPGIRFNQTVEGNRLILEPLYDVDALAGSLGTGKASVAIDEQKKRARTAMAKAAMKGSSPGE